jgi:hypothetical protein
MGAGGVDTAGQWSESEKRGERDAGRSLPPGTANGASSVPAASTVPDGVVR